MKRDFLTVLFIFLLLVLGCRKSETTTDSDSTSLFGPADQTKEAYDLVDEANTELKKIRVMYKENEEVKKELLEAMNNREIEKVKKIADGLVIEINDGMNIGESAISKIEKAQELNINETFKDYLRLKEQSLRKQLEAFKFRFDTAKYLRDNYGGQDKAEIEKAKATLKEQDENFQKYMEAGRELSVRANKLYKDNLQQKN
jgi:predicted RND superfamily exporter protein